MVIPPLPGFRFVKLKVPSRRVVVETGGDPELERMTTVAFAIGFPVPASTTIPDIDAD